VFPATQISTYYREAWSEGGGRKQILFCTAGKQVVADSFDASPRITGLTRGDSQTTIRREANVRVAHATKASDIFASFRTRNLKAISIKSSLDALSKIYK